jgi:hypothetical protein
MSIQFTIQLWWAIPSLFTVASVFAAFYCTRNDNGYLGGISTLMFLIPALAVSTVAWVIGAVCK